MKVLLIGNLAEDRQESMLRFTALLQSGLAARGHQVTVLAPTLRLARFGPAYRYGGLPKYLGYFDKFVLFPQRLQRWIKSARPDVVHLTDHASAMYGSVVPGTPVLATCHDLLQVRAALGEVPRQSVGFIGRRYQAWIRKSLGQLSLVACVSAKTREDVLRLTGLPEERVALVPNALNYPYQAVPALECRRRLGEFCARQGKDPALLNPAGGFVMHVGGGHWYKNREGLLSIYAQLRLLLPSAPLLVIVGPPLAAEHAEIAARLGLTQHIVVLPTVTNPELEALYNVAEALIFPSWEEGFGWPIVEAQACGCPVFASRRSPMTEVAGRHAGYFDPNDPTAAAQAIAAAWPQRRAMRDQALAEAHQWQPARMIEGYEALYRRLVP